MDGAKAVIKHNLHTMYRKQINWLINERLSDMLLYVAGEDGHGRRDMTAPKGLAKERNGIP